MSNLIPIGRDVSNDTGRRVVVTRGVHRTLSRIEGRAMVVLGQVQAEGIIARTKLREMDFTTEDAINGHAYLTNVIDVAAGGNPVTHEECRGFLTVNSAVKRALLQRLGEDYLSQ